MTAQEIETQFKEALEGGTVYNLDDFACNVDCVNCPAEDACLYIIKQMIGSPITFIAKYKELTNKDCEL